VWVNRGDWKLFPNLYTILVGHTGLGKGRAINPAVALLREAGCAKILSDKLTIQYILEEISDHGSAATATLNLGGKQITLGQPVDATCFIAAPEIEDLLTTSETMPPLKELWEAKDGPFEYGTRGKGLVRITKPCPTLLGGCTPTQVAVLFPPTAVGGGFVRRINFVYAAERAASIPWPTERNGNDPHRDALVYDLKQIASLKGQFIIDPVAKQILTAYYDSTGCTEFVDEATSSYETSRFFHVIKLAMCLSLARQDQLVLNFIDVSTAINMINQVCEGLKRIFRAVGDSEQATALDKILRYLELRSRVTYVTRSDIMSALWKDVGSNQNLDILLATLEAGKMIKTEQRSGITTYVPIKEAKRAR
jgi:hypothetical protein